MCVCASEGFACLTAIFACAFLLFLLRITPLLLLILSSQHKVLIFFVLALRSVKLISAEILVCFSSSHLRHFYMSDAQSTHHHC